MSVDARYESLALLVRSRLDADDTLDCSSYDSTACNHQYVTTIDDNKQKTPSFLIASSILPYLSYLKSLARLRGSSATRARRLLRPG